MSSPCYQRSIYCRRTELHEEKNHECSVVAETNTVVQPHAVVVHTRNDESSLGTVLAPDERQQTSRREG